MTTVTQVTTATTYRVTNHDGLTVTGKLRRIDPQTLAVILANGGFVVLSNSDIAAIDPTL